MSEIIKDEELMEDVSNFVLASPSSARAAMSLIVIEMLNHDLDGAMETLLSYGTAMAYAYTEHRGNREEALSQLFFGKEK